MKTLSITLRSVLFTLTILLAGGTTARAQEEGEVSKADQSFSLVYIAQDATMPIQRIEENLQTAWNRAVLNGPTIFYLSRGREEPVIVKVNIEGDDNRDDFENVLLPIIKQNVFHSVDAPHDKQELLQLLEMHSYVAPDGTPLYRETNFDFHVGQDFWMLGCNETIIATLFFELDIKRHIADEFHFNVFCPRNVNYDEDMGPFGLLNPDDCRRNINLSRIY